MPATGFLEKVQTAVRTARSRQRAISSIKREDALRTISSADSNPFRLPMVYGNDSFFLTREAAWTAVRVPSKSSGFLSDRGRKAQFNGALRFFAKDMPAEKENSGQLLLTNRVVSMNEWEAQILDPTSKYNPADLTSGYQAYVRAARKSIDAASFSEPATYVFIRQGLRGGTGITKNVNKVVDLFLASAGFDDSQPDKDEIAFWGPQAETIRRNMQSSWLSAEPVPRRELEWIMRHQDTPGLPTPDVSPSDEQEWGAGAWRNALSSYSEEVPLGVINKRHYYGIKIDGPTGTGTSYCAFLPVSTIPQAVRYDANWMNYGSKLDFPVDINMHYEVVGAVQVEQLLDKAVETAEAQEAEAAEAGTHDTTASTQRAALDQSRTRMSINKTPMVYWQAVMCVYADDTQTLLDRISALIQHYSAINFDLVCPPLDQRELYYQSFPGAPVTLSDWFHRTDTQYLSAAQPWLDQSIGNSVDVPGDYQGYTLEIDSSGNLKRGRPVFYNLFSVVDAQGKAPTEGVIASPGAGKRLPLTTPIMLADGTWTTLGKLKTGDRICGTHGPTTVTLLSPIKADAPALRMIFDDGSEQICDPEHRWTMYGPKAGTTTWPQPSAASTPTAALVDLLSRVDPQDSSTPESLSRAVGDTKNLDDYTAAAATLTSKGRTNPVGEWWTRDLCELVLRNRGIDTDSCALTLTAAETKDLVDKGHTLTIPLPTPIKPPDSTHPTPSDIAALATAIIEATATPDQINEAMLWPVGDRASLLTQALPTGTTLYASNPLISALATLTAATGVKAITTSDSIHTTNHTARTLIAVEPAEPTAMRCITVDAPNHLYLAGPRLIPTHNTVSRGLRPVHEDALRNVTQYVWDPKGDFLPLYQHASDLMLDQSKVRLLDLGDPSISISLDAFSIAEYDPDNAIDDRETSAKEVLRLVAQEQTSDANQGSGMFRRVIDEAVSRVMKQELATGTPPTMQGVLQLLRMWSTTSKNLPEFRNEKKQEDFLDAVDILLQRYESLERDTIGRLLFRDPTEGALFVEEGTLTIFVAMKLKTTEPGATQTPTTVVGDTIAAMMTDYIRSLLSRLPKKVQKAATFDEWHVIKRNRKADNLVDWMRRMGRSRRCAVRQMSQSAKDLSASNLACVWVGWATEKEEAEASCDLLGIEKTNTNVETILGLSKGEFIFKDGYGRYARVFVDFWDRNIFETFRTEADVAG